MDSSIEVRLLGTLEIRRVGGPVIGPDAWRTRSSLEAVAALAMAPGMALPARDLARALWPGSADAQASGSLRTAVYDARRTLGSHHLVRTKGALKLIGAWCDVPAFEGAINLGMAAASDGRQEQAVTSIRLARNLWTGHLAPDLRSPVLSNHRTDLSRRWLSALLSVAELCVNNHDTSAALDLACSATELAPDEETAIARLMRISIDAGSPALALSVFSDLETRLAQDLRIEPSHHLRSLHHEALTADRGTSSARGPMVRASAHLNHLPALARDALALLATAPEGVAIDALPGLLAEAGGYTPDEIGAAFPGIVADIRALGALSSESDRLFLPIRLRSLVLDWSSPKALAGARTALAATVIAPPDAEPAPPAETITDLAYVALNRARLSGDAVAESALHKLITRLLDVNELRERTLAVALVVALWAHRHHDAFPEGLAAL